MEDKLLKQLILKIDSSLLSQEEKDKYWQNFSERTRAKLTELIFANLDEESKRKFKMPEEDFNLEDYYNILISQLGNPSVSQKIGEEYDRLLNEELIKN